MQKHLSAAKALPKIQLLDYKNRFTPSEIQASLQDLEQSLLQPIFYSNSFTSFTCKTTQQHSLSPPQFESLVLLGKRNLWNHADTWDNEAYVCLFIKGQSFHMTPSEIQVSLQDLEQPLLRPIFYSNSFTCFTCKTTQQHSLSRYAGRHVILGFDFSAEEYFVINSPESLIGLRPDDLSIMNYGEEWRGFVASGNREMFHLICLNCQQTEPHGALVGTVIMRNLVIWHKIGTMQIKELAMEHYLLNWS
ncbi:hypothetical protein V6N12_042185 [Hibiscus sabdariffa]|uniref:Uncharacterized protein n=1 Tax=Hibiscus sabdariffa TaxID=183260 RepID=A0ABR2EE13_9ROSI